MNRSSLVYPVILKAHKRFHLHFTPTSASWLNMVERFFAEITRNLTRRGAFTSVANLKAAIIECLENHNAASKPFVWTMSAGQILEKVARAKQTLESLHQIRRLGGRCACLSWTKAPD
jgi:DDE superfamily endonuclease